MTEEAVPSTPPKPAEKRISEAHEMRGPEPVRKGLRVIVEDEIARLDPEVDLIERVRVPETAAERNARETSRIPVKPERFVRPLVISAGSIESGGKTIMLAGVKAPQSGEKCETGGGKSWPCGNFAKGALQRLLRARTIECEGEHVSETQFSGRCRIGKTDLSQWLVEQGWAEAASADFEAAMAQAKEAKIGLWRD